MSSFAEVRENCLTFRQFESRIGGFIPHQDFEDRNCGFPDHDPEDPADQFDMAVSERRSVYLGWVPVTWSSSPVTNDLDEVDDCREVLFLSDSLEEANAVLKLTFGVYAEAEEWTPLT